MNFKKILKDLAPPILTKFLKQKKKISNQKKTQYDKRRWWEGNDLAGDNLRFKEIFKFNSNQSTISTLNNETRDCIKVIPKQKLKISFLGHVNNKEVLFSFGNKFSERSIEGNYQVYIDGKKKIEIKNPLSKTWNNSYVKSDFKYKDLEIINNTNYVMYFACPIIFNQFNKEKDNYKNIIYIILDQLDAKSLKEFEKDPEDLKFINTFFDNSIDYQNFFASAEWTLPCFSSIFSGKTPSSHGYFDLKTSENINDVVPQNNLLEYLRKKGFSNFGISKSKGHHAGFNFQKYFDRLLYYHDQADGTHKTDLDYSKKAIDHLELNKNGKNFIFLHFMSSHTPFYEPSINEDSNLDLERYVDPSKEFYDAILENGDTKLDTIMDSNKLKKITQRQKERMKSLDIALGQLLSYMEKKDMKKNSLVILSSDHGPHYLRKPNEPLLNRSILNIPLKIFDYKNKEKKIIEDYSSQTDIFPLIKGLFEDEHKENLIPPYGNKNSPILSESIFNNKYKISIRSEKHTFHFSCRFDPENLSILMNKDTKIYIDYNIKNNSSDNKENLKLSYLNFIYDHLDKSKVINVKRDIN